MPDAMHTVKDYVEYLFKLIVGKKDKRKIEISEANLGQSVSCFSMIKV